ncbi:MAG: sodium:proton antiporter [Leptospirales bacterium]|nr:sodium:proton antiporter [Leptospirales bacterium]
MWRRNVVFFLAILCLPGALLAEGGEHPHTPISVFWVAPFALMLLAIAVVPMIHAHFWEKNLWWISLGIFAAPMAAALATVLRDPLGELAIEKAEEYISFILLLGSLFVISGGILVTGKIRGTPSVNTLFLLFGTVLASFVGTTGASMLLIRPLLRALQERRRKAHVIVFFIFLVSNVGGLLTPLGDPPLFLGYLSGVPFEWTLRLFPQWALASGILLTLFFFLDFYIYRRDGHAHFDTGPLLESELEVLRSEVDDSIERLDIPKLREGPGVSLKMLLRVRETLLRTREALEHLAAERRGGGLRIRGGLQFLLLVGVVAGIYGQGLLKKAFPDWWPSFGPQELWMLLLAGVSLLVAPVKGDLRTRNGFSFGPIKEVALLFAGIFATMIPSLYILESHGASLGLKSEWQFFWVTGALSSFLDNAPTYLTFLAVAKGLAASAGLPNDLGFVLNDGGHLTAGLLAAISTGAVFMGANSYIGNGPNFMVRAIAEQEDVKMPSFFGYMAYSGAILIPIFILLTFVFFI